MSRSGELLRRARSTAGLTQRQLAGQTGVAPTLISAYENGRRTPGGDALLQLLEACGQPAPTHPVDSPALRRSAAGLEQVVALGMALPRRSAGRLDYPSFHTFGIASGS